jgi:hypothetical protein
MRKQRSEETGQKCIKCKEHKPFSAFDLFQTGGGIRNTCKTCRCEMSKLRNRLRKTHPVPAPGPCPICKNHTETWILDHCHTTEDFRGYICDRCNRGLGCFSDDSDIVVNALNYLSNDLLKKQKRNQVHKEEDTTGQQQPE